MPFSDLDRRMMARAVALAERGRYGVSPNPMVGAVIARRGTVVGEGHHARAGGPHAEIVALARAGERARGATLYVTLEPCAHFGATPPCADAVIAAGIARVVAARRDPDPRVDGRGLGRLRRAGVRAESGLLAAEAEEQNEKFDVFVRQNRPFVLAKVAATLDGRIADASGRSRWITGREARRRAMEWREEYDAVLVGARTVLADDPRLTRRLGLNRTGRHVRVVVDGLFRIPEDARLFRGPGEVEIWTSTRRPAKERRLARRGIRVRHLAGRSGVDLAAGLAQLAREGIASLIVEGGARTLTSFHEARLIDRWAVFVSPRILGGAGSVPILGGRDVALGRAVALDRPRVEILSGDVLVTGRT